MTGMTECRYCGNGHDVRELCHARRVSRRRFLLALGATAAVVAAAPHVPSGFTLERTIAWPRTLWPETAGILAPFDDGTYGPYLGFVREVTLAEA
jgi:hypothetical protein